VLCGGRGKARSNDFRRGQATGYNFGKLKNVLFHPQFSFLSRLIFRINRQAKSVRISNLTS
jgi:hypothetical protein